MPDIPAPAGSGEVRELNGTRKATGPAAVELGPFPEDDGWSWVYRFYSAFIQPYHLLRRAVRAYLWPRRLEEAGDGRPYRLLGVQHFGRIIPTGGVTVRRITGARMAPYTLAGTSLGAARAFFYRTCVFEALHLPFLLALLALSAHRLSMGSTDLALENLLINLVANIYPTMHHRHTRVRILRLLRRHARRRPSLPRTS